MKIPVESSTSYRGRNARPNYMTLALFVAIALAAGAGGYLFSPARSHATAAWYAALAKPSWVAPSNWFGPAWITFYCLMGIAAWLVSRERYHARYGTALIAYFVQLLLNAAWAPLFFGARNIGAGLFVTVALWITIAWSMREFISVRPPAAWLMLPYLGWVTYALALNFSLWRLNQ
jgi:tryptophan-rich sensory protein